jgi:hypothetical protein
MFDQAQEASAPGSSRAMSTELFSSAEAPLGGAAGVRRRLVYVTLHIGRRVSVTVGGLIRAAWAYGTVVNELNSLTDADFRDMLIYRGDASVSAWDEARRRAGNTPESVLVVIGMGRLRHRSNAGRGRHLGCG